MSIKNEELELFTAIGEIRAAMRIQLSMAAISGDMARKAVDAGFSLQEIADNVGDYPAAIQTKIDLANRLNALMKSGTAHAQALDVLCEEGWINRLDSPDDAREGV